MPTTLTEYLRPLLCGAVIAIGCLQALRTHAQSSNASSLPATVPTSAISPSQLPSANPPLTAANDSHADIAWDGNVLQISAVNVRLNRLLRDLATKTGLRVTGSAPDESIFGTYGPGRLDDVLSQLLDGVAVNMLLIDSLGAKPKDLVLTARGGGPNAPLQQAQNEGEANTPAYSSAEQTQPATTRQVQQPAAPGDGGSTSQSTADGGTPSNGVRTPQEIFEQLQRLRSRANRQ